MENYKFRCWGEKAVSGIVFPPDQRKVYRELIAHMEDHRDHLLEQGVDPETARQMTVDAMGDPWPIAKDLARIHRPFWGYFLRVTRIMLIVALVITLIPFVKHTIQTDYGIPMGSAWSLFHEDNPGGDDARTLLHLSQPDISQKSDGYTFTLTDMVFWHNNEYSNNVLYLYMKEFHPLPWAEHGAVGNWFWAEDSLGNVYECYYEHRPDEETPVLYNQGNKTNPFSYTYAFWVSSDFPEEAEWIDLRYARDGRNLSFRVYLTGGDST